MLMHDAVGLVNQTAIMPLHILEGVRACRKLQRASGYEWDVGKKHYRKDSLNDIHTDRLSRIDVAAESIFTHEPSIQPMLERSSRCPRDSPSPRPSPPGRGRSIASAWEISQS